MSHRWTVGYSRITYGTITLRGAPFQGTLIRASAADTSSNYNSGPTHNGRPDFKFELFPLHSPLLRESLLVSFPPLIDMLKFSGYPYLIRGQPAKIGGCWLARTTASEARRITTLGAGWHRH